MYIRSEIDIYIYIYIYIYISYNIYIYIYIYMCVCVCVLNIIKQFLKYILTNWVRLAVRSVTNMASRFVK